MEAEQNKIILSLFNELMSQAMNRAYEDHLLNRPGISLLPELRQKATDVCNQIRLELSDFFEQQADQLPAQTQLQITGRFCLCAGMGAFWLWKKDYRQVREKGIVALLTKHGGIKSMDQSVYKLIGIQSNSEELARFNTSIINLFHYLLSQATERSLQIFPEARMDPKRFAPLIELEVFKLMYRLGINIQSQRTTEEKDNTIQTPSNLRELEQSYIQMRNLVTPALKSHHFLDAYSPTLASRVFQLFPSLHFDPEYEFDTFTLSGTYKDGEDCLLRKYDAATCNEKRLYAHRKKIRSEFLPTIPDPAQKRSFFQKLLGRKPKDIHYVKTVYRDDLVIRLPLCYTDNLYSIPSPLNYVTCDCTILSAWELFLFASFVKQYIYPILFSLDDLKRRRPGLFTGEEVFMLEKDVLQDLHQLDFTPQVRLDRSVAKISCYQLRLGGITKVEATMIYKKDRFFVPSFKDTFAFSFTAQIQNQEQIQSLSEKDLYGY